MLNTTLEQDMREFDGDKSKWGVGLSTEGYNELCREVGWTEVDLEENWDTLQSTFDTVVTHLRKQGRRSADMLSGSMCKYREKADDKTMLKCAAGCLIPDECYRPIFEGFTILIPTDDTPGNLPDRIQAILDKPKPPFIGNDRWDVFRHDLIHLSQTEVYPGPVGRILQHYNHNLLLVALLQSVHDRQGKPQWEKTFRMLAYAFDLTYTPPKEKEETCPSPST